MADLIDDTAFKAMVDKTTSPADTMTYSADRDFSDNWLGWSRETEQDMRGMDKILGGISKGTGLTSEEIFTGYGTDKQNPKLTEYFSKGKKAWEGIQSRGDHLSGSGITSEQDKINRAESSGYFAGENLRAAVEKYSLKGSDLSTTYSKYKDRNPEVTKLLEGQHGVSTPGFGPFDKSGGKYKPTRSFKYRE